MSQDLLQKKALIAAPTKYCTVLYCFIFEGFSGRLWKMRTGGISKRQKLAKRGLGVLIEGT